MEVLEPIGYPEIFLSKCWGVFLKQFFFLPKYSAVKCSSKQYVLSLEHFKYHPFEPTWVSIALAVSVQSPKGCWMSLFEGNMQGVCEATYWGNSSSCAFHSEDPLAGTVFPGLSSGWILLASLSLLMNSLDQPHKSHLHFLHPVLIPESEHCSPALLQWLVSGPGVDAAGRKSMSAHTALCSELLF